MKKSPTCIRCDAPPETGQLFCGGCRRAHDVTRRDKRNAQARKRYALALARGERRARPGKIARAPVPQNNPGALDIPRRTKQKINWHSRTA